MLAPLPLLLALAAPAGGEAAPPLPGAVAISPHNHFIALDRGPQTHAYRLENLGTLPIRLRVRASGFRLREDYTIELDEADPGLAAHTVFNPVEFALAPGSSQAVRFAVRPPALPPPGEHRLAMVFEQIPEPGEAPPPAEGTGITLRTQVRIVSAVYATVGEPTRRGALEAVRLEPDRLLTRIAATGEAHLRPRGTARIEPLAGGEARELPLSGLPVLPGERRWVPHAFPDFRLEPGRYRVRLEGTLGESPLAASLEVSLEAEPGAGDGRSR
ncbi:MAG: hypothetical protein RML12_03995 [Xanthomonadales bacterium]|nr:hypothetical protein [Xanthomonadales bacterium]